MKEFGLQLYSIRDHFTTEESTKEAFAKMAEMGYTTAQTAGVYAYISPEKFSEYAKEYGIDLFATHYDYELIKNDVEGTVKYHKTIGAKYIGIGGVVTFKNANKVKELAASVPLDRLLVETDCPYLAPHPYRGQLNHSA